MVQTTKTLNPLPFGDLEPHRFEDLVRQLSYDFKNWRSLEPTGRLGADDGYDARGFEIVDLEQEKDIDEDNIDNDPITGDRLWQIQCKREKSITPAKLEGYINEMIPEGADIPYGVVFSAPCEFSKKTRDLFRQKMIEKGVQEFYMWGRSDLEDMLFQPKNDNLLYAYFGISLIIRRRAVKTQIRLILATKRKAIKHLGEMHKNNYLPVLVRDVEDKKYPYIEDVTDFKKRPIWKKYYFTGYEHNGIKLLIRKFFAYRKMDETNNKLLEWDFSEETNLALIHDDHWNKEENDTSGRGHHFVDKEIEQKNIAFYEIERVIPFERIIEIDPFGDNFSDDPHIFVQLENDMFFQPYGGTFKLVSRDTYAYPYYLKKEDDLLRVKIFPKKFPKVPKPKPLPSMGSSKGNKKETKEEFSDL